MFVKKRRRNIICLNVGHDSFPKTASRGCSIPKINTVSIFIPLRLHKLEQVVVNWGVQERIIIHPKKPVISQLIQNIEQPDCVESNHVSVSHAKIAAVTICPNLWNFLNAQERRNFKMNFLEFYFLPSTGDLVLIFLLKVSFVKYQHVMLELVVVILKKQIETFFKQAS